MNIAVIITCHNRRDKTLKCLEYLYKSLSFYENKVEKNVNLVVFLTDDGCSDGTANSVKHIFSDEQIEIIYGNGQLYWAGGMRLAWNRALEKSTHWDFFLLLNDDTYMNENCFEELFSTHQYSIEKYQRAGIYSGITKSISNPLHVSYGGDVWLNRFLGKSRRLEPSGVPQECDMANANILLISNDVVKSMGVLYEGYRHANADYDYSLKAKKKGFPVLVTANVCGECEKDHDSIDDISKKICNMSLSERKVYFRSPLHSNKDYLLYIRRNLSFRYPLVLFGRFLNVYFPFTYYKYLCR